MSTLAPPTATPPLFPRVAALKLYFDRSCAAFLLYRFERLQLQQYLDSRPGSDERVLCQVYGAEHMLRLFVKLPLLLSHANLSPTDAAALASRLQRVVDWLDANLPKMVETMVAREIARITGRQG